MVTGGHAKKKSCVKGFILDFFLAFFRAILVHMPGFSSSPVGSGHSSDALRLADWISQHRLTLRQMGYGSLIALAVLTWGFSLWTLLDTYAISYPREQRIPLRIASVFIDEGASAFTAPAPLDIGGAQSLIQEGARRHIYAPVSNPNPRWWAEIRYRFRDGTTETPLRSAALLPQDTRLLTELGWEKGGLTSPSLSIESVVWRRIDSTLTAGDYAAYKQQRSQLITTDPAYQSDIEIEGRRLGRSTFTLKNPSGYTYRDVEFLTLVSREGTVVGMQKLVLPTISPGSEQVITQVWPENPLAVTKTDVQTFVHLLDPETFLKP
jgi:hypothetical protein